jgi:hypothetical protein
VNAADLAARFDDFRRSAFRLETLQHYAIPAEDERLRAFREGLPRPERSVRTSDWLRRVAVTTAAGKSWSRVHLIREPLSEYLRYQLVGYVESAAVGEDIRLAWDTPDLPDVGDFWLFDAGTPDVSAVLMRYGDAGQVLSFEDVTDPAALDDLWAVRDLTWARSWTLAEHLAQRSV